MNKAALLGRLSNIRQNADDFPSAVQSAQSNAGGAIGDPIFDSVAMQAILDQITTQLDQATSTAIKSTVYGHIATSIGLYVDDVKGNINTLPTIQHPGEPDSYLITESGIYLTDANADPHVVYNLPDDDDYFVYLVNLDKNFRPNQMDFTVRIALGEDPTTLTVGTNNFVGGYKIQGSPLSVSEGFGLLGTKDNSIEEHIIDRQLVSAGNVNQATVNLRGSVDTAYQWRESYGIAPPGSDFTIPTANLDANSYTENVIVSDRAVDVVPERGISISSTRTTSTPTSFQLDDPSVGGASLFNVVKGFSHAGVNYFIGGAGKVSNTPPFATNGALALFKIDLFGESNGAAPVHSVSSERCIQIETIVNDGRAVILNFNSNDDINIHIDSYQFLEEIQEFANNVPLVINYPSFGGAERFTHSGITYFLFWSNDGSVAPRLFRFDENSRSLSPAGEIDVTGLANLSNLSLRVTQPAQGGSPDLPGFAAYNHSTSQAVTVRAKVGDSAPFSFEGVSLIPLSISLLDGLGQPTAPSQVIAVQDIYLRDMIILGRERYEQPYISGTLGSAAVFNGPTGTNQIFTGNLGHCSRIKQVYIGGLPYLLCVRPTFIGGAVLLVSLSNTNPYGIVVQINTALPIDAEFISATGNNDLILGEGDDQIVVAKSNGVTEIYSVNITLKEYAWRSVGFTNNVAPA